MIAVVGSINTDLVVEVPRMPRPGETLQGQRASFYPGGKGANQAVAAARLGAGVAFFGKLGEDTFGEQLLRGLTENGVDVSAIGLEENVSSGLANIWVTDDGENAIALTPGANAQVDRSYVDRNFKSIAQSEVLLLQLEIPLKTIEYLLRSLPSSKPTVILDPAPAQDLSCLPLERIDILTPNQLELASITGSEDIEEGLRQLLARGVKHILCTLGNKGAYWASQQRAVHVPAYKVEPIDTTAAGDAFNGALAWALLTTPIDEAVRWANAAGALATTRKGAQPSLPTLDELKQFLDTMSSTDSRGRSGHQP